MDLPIRFPDEADIIAEEAARFRALSGEAKVRALGDCFQDYLFLATASGRKDELDRFAEEEDRLRRQAIQDFAARHAY
jgi:hypothetical protein